MSRNCGYCKDAGHQKPKCPLFLDHRKQVLTHVPAMRKQILDALIKVGFGVGAIIEHNREQENIKGIAMIQDYSFIGNMNFMGHKKVKYSKQVRLIPSGIGDFYGSIYFSAIAMWDGISEKRTISVPYAQLKGQGESNYYKFTTLLSPSHDYPEFNPSLFVQNIRMPARLATRPLTRDDKWNDYVLETGIMPPL